jgi:hypothetical protein
VLLCFILAAFCTTRGVCAQLLIDVDFGGGSSTAEIGPAAIGHGPADYWNYYTRNDANGSWRSFGALTNLSSVEQVPTGAGLTITNAPGAWGNGSADEMYNSYDYPFDGGNVTVVVTNLDAGAYDVYVYGIDSSYEISVAGSTYGVESLPAGPVTNPAVWQEGLQYVVFPSVKVNPDDSITLTVRPGSAGYATIAGMQIAGSVATNHPPVARAQNVVLPQDSGRSVTLTASDLDRDALTYNVLTQPAHGSLAGTPPDLTYTPDNGYSGPDSFTFSASDSQVESAPATVSISIVAPGTETLIDIDIGGGSATAEQGPAATGHKAADFWNYYTRNDGHGGWSSFGTLPNLKSVEGLPTGAGLTIANAPGAWGLGWADDMLNSYDYPFDGGNVTVTLTNLGAGAYDVYVYGLDSRYELSAGSLSYGIKPLPNAPVSNPVVWQEGVQYVLFRSVRITNDAPLILTVHPGAGGYAAIAGLQIASVIPTNHPPVANGQTVNMLQDSASSVVLTGSDPDGDALTYSIVSQPGHGTLSGTAPALQYSPAAGFTGADSFGFTVNDGQFDSAPATVNVSVVSTNTSLLVNIDVGGADSTSEVGPAATGHTPTDFWNYYTRNNGHGGWLSFGVLTNLATSEHILTPAGFTITNAPGSWGNGSTDDMFNSYDYPFDGGNVTMTLTNLSTGAYDLFLYGIDSSYEVTVDGLSYGNKSLPANAVTNPVVWQEDMQYVLFPGVQLTNGQSLTVTVHPGVGGYATISGLQLSGVTPGNHAPRAYGQEVLVGQDSSAPITLNGSDIDGDVLTFVVSGPPQHGSLSGSAPNLTYIPTPGYSGPDRFAFIVNDGSLDSSPATIQLNVFPKNTRTLIDVDFGGAAATREIGPAATGHTSTDFWNYYTRNDGQGGWLTFGALTNLSTVENVPTAVGLTIANAPGSWGNGSTDDMYNSYDYPFDGGDLDVTVTNLETGTYDFYIYGIDSTYELAVNVLSYGSKTLPVVKVTNPVVWQEGVQYVLFHSVQLTNGDTVNLTVRPGTGGYATISGMQIGLALPEDGSHPVALTVPAVFAPAATTSAATAITSSGAVLNSVINPRGAPTSVWFEWGTTTNLGNSTPPQHLSAVSSNLTVTASISTGLGSNQPCYFRVRASNPVGAGQGTMLSFAWNSARPTLFGSVSSAAAGGVALHFAGTPGQSYRVQTSTDLQHWTDAGLAGETSAGVFDFVVSDSPGLPARFYRLLAP